MNQIAIHYIDRTAEVVRDVTDYSIRDSHIEFTTDDVISVLPIHAFWRVEIKKME